MDVSVFFFFNDTATTEIYTLSLHDALPISPPSPPRRGDGWTTGPRRSASRRRCSGAPSPRPGTTASWGCPPRRRSRSEEHTSELQSRQYLVCRLLLEKKKTVSLARWSVLTP